MTPLVQFNGTPWVVVAFLLLMVILGIFGAWSRLKRMRKDE